MSPIRVTFGRTVGRARSLFSTAFAVGSFLAVAAAAFAHGLEAADGGTLSLTVVWAVSVAPYLPALVALLGMEVWSDERQSGRMAVLLATPVRERDYTIGKFLGVCALSMFVLALSLVSSLGTLWLVSPSALAMTSLASVSAAFCALSLQAVLWSAIAVAASAFFRHAATAACAALIATVALPRGIWAGLKNWSPSGQTFFGELPLDAHVVDIASGLVPLGTVAFYLLAAGLVLFVATKAVASCRLVGRGAAVLRLSTATAVFLALVLLTLTGTLLYRLNPIVEFPATDSPVTISQRTRNILSESGETVTITAFQSRRDPSARAVGRLLRTLKREAESVGGAHIELRFVDPKWDIGLAERMVRRGVVENSLVFENGRRFAFLPISDGVGERVCASAIRRVSSSLQRKNVYWSIGHGEAGFDDYGSFGMSEIARELYREGYVNQALDLSSDQPIPGDCALILVAGARDDFSRAELGRINSYLTEGGRLLVLLGSAKSGGVVTSLPTWGLRPADAPIPQVKTRSGTDVIVSDFSDHPISETMKGSRIILERPVSFLPSSVAESGAGADRIGYSPVATVGDAAVVAAIERGVGAGDDLALRPTRVVAIGDASFVLNGQLTARASANRDFFLNAVAYLSGADASGAGCDAAGTLSLDIDRDARRKHVYLSSVLVPAVIFAVLAAVVVRRRRKA